MAIREKTNRPARTPMNAKTKVTHKLCGIPSALSMPSPPAVITTKVKMKDRKATTLRRVAGASQK
jgi:hypothetical protein